MEASSLKARRSWNELLNRSLSEEEIADNLMTQVARELMSKSRSGMTKIPKRTRAGAVAEKDE
jgi:hypothetical protein